MDNNFVRQLLIFYYLSDLKKHTAFELSERLEVSKRTVSYDVQALTNYANYHGTNIICNQEGYSLEVTDEEEFEKTWRFIQRSIMHYPVIGGQVDAIGRPMDILRVLFLADKRITVDDIADKLYVSKESIKKDYKKARSILSGFQLTYNAYNRAEMNIVGREFDKRMCMMFLNHPLHLMETHTAGEFSDNSRSFGELFSASAVANEVRQAMVREEMPRAVRRRSGDTGRIRGYLSLSANRLQSGFPLVYSEEEKEFLRQFPMYDVAKNFTERSLKLAHLPYEENETFGLEQYMLMNMDLNIRSYNRADYLPVYNEAETLAMEISDWLGKRYGFRLEKLERYAERMAIRLIPLLVQIRFGASGHYRNYMKSGESESFGDPFGNIMGIQMRLFFSQVRNASLSRYNQMLLGRTISSLLGRIEYQEAPRKILVRNQFGIESARELAHTVDRILPQHLRYEWQLMGEDRGVEDADLIISQGSMPNRNPIIPTIYVDLVPTADQLVEIIRFFIEKKSGGSTFYSIFHGTPKIIKGYPFTSKDSFIKDLAQQLVDEKSDEQQTKIENHLKCFDFSCCFNGACVLSIDRELLQKPIFLVYCLKGLDARWNGRRISSIFVVGMDCGGSTEQARYVRDFLTTVTGDKKLLKEFVENGAPEKVESKIVIV